MSDSAYSITAGISAILLAVLFPIVWLAIPFSMLDGDIEHEIMKDLMTLSVSDLLFIITGALEVYVFIALRSLCKDLINGKGLEWIINIQIGCLILLYSSACLNVGVALLDPETASTVMELILGSYIVFMITMSFVVSLLTLVIGVLLLQFWQTLETSLRAFSILLVMSGIFFISVIFAFAATLLYSVALITFAFYLLGSSRSTVEVV
ncbi:hypothetical protein [uncultured Umboniibacter sp.]|uniref:hypothetical protein n=1 Tax=uncultured Umboniibacter sp. TaxID=1798917 RepID=UPI002626F7A2|nr:hypothetical protein [uncultured Umboniibacter sp.]